MPCQENRVVENMTRIAVLCTCHNRRDTTLTALHSLKHQDIVSNVMLHVYLVDDGSSDGTGKSVSDTFPDIFLLRGNGSLYWGGGMRMAFQEACKDDYDYYLWLNDDVVLFSHAVRTLLATSQYLKIREGHDAIVVGSTKDPITGNHTYGGRRVPNRLPPFNAFPVFPSARPLPCDTACGNIMLVPKKIAEELGCVSEPFTQCGGGDYDYGLQATMRGYSCWVAPQYLGTCQRKPVKGSILDKTLPVKVRLKKMSDPTEVGPTKHKLIFVKRNTGHLWPLHALLILLSRVCFPRLWLFWMDLKNRNVYRQ